MNITTTIDCPCEAATNHDKHDLWTLLAHLSTTIAILLVLGLT